MKRLLLIILCFVAISTFAQEAIEISPYSNAVPSYTPPRDTFNLEFSFDPLAFIGDYGVESNGSHLYVTQWYGDSIAKYDQAGNIIEIFTIPGVERVRDMAYDGQYYYAGNNNDYLYVIDMENKVLVNTIYTSFNVRGVAYDPNEDVLWTSGNWAPEFNKLDMQGNVLDSWIASGITMNSITGLAFDNQTAGGPSLWGFSQDSTGCVIVKYDIATQSQTGNMIDMSGISTSLAGGLFIEDLPVRSIPMLGGCVQNDIIFAFDLVYANAMVVGIEDEKVISSLEIYPVPAQEYLNIKINVEEAIDIDCRIVNLAGQVVKIKKLVVNSSNEVMMDISDLIPGTYMVQLASDKGFSISKKIIITN